jgi:hypothetical protein
LVLFGSLVIGISLLIHYGTTNQGMLQRSQSLAERLSKHQRVLIGPDFEVWLDENESPYWKAKHPDDTSF